MGDIVYREFTGVRNDVGPERFGPGDLVAADNCDLDSTGKLKRRRGFAPVLAGDFHSLWSDGDLCLMASDSELLRLLPNYTTITLRDDLSSVARMAYCRVNERVYYSNGYQTGVVENGASRSWGIAPPVYQPAAAAIGGELYAGTYQYALTFLRQDGQESGTSVAGSIDLAANSGIAFSFIQLSTDPGVTHKAIYLSPANGEVLYRALTLDNATTSASYTDNGVRLQSPLDTQFLQDAIPGHLICYYRGRLYVARDNLLFPAEPFAYELFDLRRYLPFDSRITLLAAMTDGIFVGTEHQQLFLAGRGPDEFEPTLKTKYGAAKLVKQARGQGDSPVAFWLSSQGVQLGLNQGGLTNLTPQYSFAATNGGAGLFRRDPISQYLALLAS